jgi:hypothetical protein
VPNENEYGWAGGSGGSGGGGGSEENPIQKVDIDRLPILPVRMMPVTNTKAVTNTRPVIGKSAQNNASEYGAGNGAAAFGFANGIGQESTTTYPLSSASEQQKKTAQDYINARRSQVLREGGKDADVYIRVVFEGPRDRNGEHNDVVIEEKLRDGNSNKPKEVYQIYVKGATQNGGLHFSGGVVSRWITEPADPIKPVNPNGLQQLPTPITPWQPSRTRVPPIVPPKPPIIPSEPTERLPVGGTSLLPTRTSIVPPVILPHTRVRDTIPPPDHQHVRQIPPSVNNIEYGINTASPQMTQDMLEVLNKLALLWAGKRILQIEVVVNIGSNVMEDRNAISDVMITVDSITGRPAHLTAGPKRDIPNPNSNKVLHNINLAIEEIVEYIKSLFPGVFVKWSKNFGTRNLGILFDIIPK